METLQLDVAIETGAEIANDPFAGAVVDISRCEIDEEDEAGAQAEQDSEDVRPEAKLTLIR